MDNRKYSTHVAEVCIRFVESYCVHTIGEKMGEPLLLEEWQKEFIREAYKVYWDEEEQSWQYAYTTILLGVSRGAGKSTLSAALCLFNLSPMSGFKGPRIVAAAASKENAKHIYNTAVNMIELSHGLSDMFTANKYIITCPETRGEFIRISADGSLNAGENPSMIVRDELWCWLSDKHIKLNEVLQTAKGKRSNCISLTVTTAGSDKDSLLGLLYFKSMKDERIENPRPGLHILRDPEAKYLFWWFAAPAGTEIDDHDAWRLANPSTHIRLEDVEAVRNDPTVSDSEFRRQYLGQFTEAHDSWFKSGIWEALASETEIPAGARVQVGVDAAFSHDTTAVVWAWAKDEASPVVLRAMVWSAREEAPHHHLEPGTIDNRLVAEFIVQTLCAKYKVTEVAYDPRFFDNIARDMSDGGLTVVPFQQGSAQMREAYNRFFSAVIGKDVTHDDDPVFNSHIAGTSGKKIESGWFVSKLKNKANDACIAAVMAYARAKADLKRRNKKYVFASKT